MVRLKNLLSHLLMILVILTLSGTPSNADEGHPHKGPASSSKPHEHRAPHGGKMATVGSYHVEVVVEAGSVIKVFLYDGEEKPVPVKEISGQIHLIFSDNHRETQELVPVVDQTYLIARIKDQGHANFKAVLSLMIDGQRQNIRLSL